MSQTFHPYIGKNYANGYKGKKILVLGESHYTDGNAGWESITNDVVSRFLAYQKGQGAFEPWMNTFTKFAKTFANGVMSNAEIADFWERIAFYNFVQEPMSGPRVAPTAEQFKNSETAFAEVIAAHKPDLIIAWGGRLWNNIPKNTAVAMDFIMHPSASGYKYGEMNEKLKRYIPNL